MPEIPEERPRRLPFAFTELDPAARREVIYIEASDAAQSFGVLYRPSSHDPKTVVYLMHPRAEFTRHYVVPGLIAHGYAVFCQNSRYLNNDIDMVHERLLLDVAAGLRHLREVGFERIVLLGNSGGGSLLGFYQSQAGQPAQTRIAVTPGGEPIDLAHEEMPPGDLYVAVAAHPGEGRFMLNVLDPAVVDEADPLATDPAWDMYNTTNGYRPFPEPSRFAAPWLRLYRERQRERNRRLDTVAREYLADRAYFRGRLQATDFPSQPDEARQAVTRHARLGRFMTIYRTLANPAYLDLVIDPSNRPPGSIFSPGDPVIGNYGAGGLARVVTPRAWLSTWSGLSSQADLPDTIRHITIPTLIVYADADCDIFPAEQAELLAHCGATDKTLEVLAWASHYLHPVGAEGRKLGDPRQRLIDLIVPWIEERIGEP